MDVADFSAAEITFFILRFVLTLNNIKPADSEFTEGLYSVKYQFANH